MNTNPLILVVEDDKAVRNLIATTLEMQNYPFVTAETGQAALLAATTQNPSLMILDLGLPDMDGVDIIRRVRSWSQMPIIVVSARSEDADKIGALDAGADDYLVKPFATSELLARLRASLRRLQYNTAPAASNVYTNGLLRLEYDAGLVFVNGKEVHLTPNEYRLLCVLAQNTGKVLTHNFLLKEVWGSTLSTDAPSLRVFMATLRKKIEADPAHPRYIQTHVGIGYRMLRVEDKEDSFL